MNRDWLYNEYGCKQNTIQCWLRKHNIKKDVKKDIRPKHPYQDKEYLIKEHIVNCKPITQIAKENNRTEDTIMYFMKKHGIDFWVLNPSIELTNQEIDEIVDLYINQKQSAYSVGKEFGITHKRVIAEVQKRGYETRNVQEAILNGNELAIDKLTDKDWLTNYYVDQKYNSVEIASYLNVSPSTVRSALEHFGIPRRDTKGENNPHWAGGVSSLTVMLRNFLTTQINPKVLKRDNYQCQLCGAKNVKFNVHHIVHFSDIIYEIANEHSDLDPIFSEDKEKLFDIITHDPRFLDEDNLITYCVHCHRHIIHRNEKREIISSQDLNN